MRAIILVVVISAFGVPASGAPPVGCDFVFFGNERLDFPDKYGILNRGDQAELSAWFNSSRTIEAGRPFRAGVELASYDKHVFGFPYVAHLNDVYDGLTFANVGFFVERVETEQDFRTLISRVASSDKWITPEKIERVVGRPENAPKAPAIHVVTADEWLSPEQLRYVLDGAEKAPKTLAIRVLNKDFHADLLAKGCFRAGDAWLADFVQLDPPGGYVREACVVIDAKNRVAVSYHELVEGMSPLAVEPLRGNGAYGGLCDPATVRRFNDSGAYIVGLIAEAKKRCKR